MSAHVTVGQFDAHVKDTDQLPINDTSTPLLGLVGEIGSLLSALKKKRRDTDAYFGYHDEVVEELGDALWYTSAVARRGGTSLADVLSRICGKAKSGEISFADLPTSSGEPGQPFETALLRLAGESGDLAKRFVDGAYID